MNRSPFLADGHDDGGVPALNESQYALLRQRWEPLAVQQMLSWVYAEDNGHAPTDAEWDRDLRDFMEQALFCMLEPGLSSTCSLAQSTAEIFSGPNGTVMLRLTRAESAPPFPEQVYGAEQRAITISRLGPREFLASFVGLNQPVNIAAEALFARFEDTSS